jgi:hypothetical protein
MRWKEKIVPFDNTMAMIEKDMQSGNLGKARDRLHGLLVSYPDNLNLRKQLGDIYWLLQMPDMAGRYWYLEEMKDERMNTACHIFEEQFKNDPAFILLSIKFKGNTEKDPDIFANQTLERLHKKAREKHSWYADYRKKGIAKYQRVTEDPKKGKTSSKMIKWGCIILAIFAAFFSGFWCDQFCKMDFIKRQEIYQ